MEKQRTVAIVLAGGKGKRMNSEVSKQYLLIQGKPVLYYALQAFQKSFVDEVILVVPNGEIPYCQKEIVDQFAFSKVKHIVEGGKERYHSVYNALIQIQNCDFVFIHDGARPFIDEDILKRAHIAAQKYTACVVGMPVKDTIKIADEEQFSKQTPNRNDVWMIQTPQVFSFLLIKEAYDKMIELEKKGKLEITITDDAMVVETFLQRKIKLIEGSYTNIKITTPEDLEVAEVLINQRFL